VVLGGLAVALAAAPARAGQGDPGPAQPGATGDAATDVATRPSPLVDRAPSLPAGLAEASITTGAGGYDLDWEMAWLEVDGRYALGGFEPLVGFVATSGLHPSPLALADLHAGVRVPITRMSAVRVLGWWRWPEETSYASGIDEVDLVETHAMGFDAVYEIRFPFLVSSRLADRGGHVFALVGELGAGFDRFHMRAVQPMRDPAIPIPPGWVDDTWALHFSAGVETQMTPRAAFEVGVAHGDLRAQQLADFSFYGALTYSWSRFDVAFRAATTSFDLAPPPAGVWVLHHPGSFRVGATVAARI